AGEGEQHGGGQSWIEQQDREDDEGGGNELRHEDEAVLQDTVVQPADLVYHVVQQRRAVCPAMKEVRPVEILLEQRRLQLDADAEGEPPEEQQPGGVHQVGRQHQGDESAAERELERVHVMKATAAVERMQQPMLGDQMWIAEHGEERSDGGYADECRKRHE